MEGGVVSSGADVFPLAQIPVPDLLTPINALLNDNSFIIIHRLCILILAQSVHDENLKLCRVG